jgi:hypothetical protein
MHTGRYRMGPRLPWRVGTVPGTVSDEICPG